VTDDEINRLVAEKVMGWISAGDCWAEKGWRSKDGAQRRRKDYFDPCNSWKAMDEVIEKVCKGKYEFSLHRSYENGTWSVRLMAWGEEEIWFRQVRTAPKAVALAALKVRGVDVG